MLIDTAERNHRNQAVPILEEFNERNVKENIEFIGDY